MEGTLNSSPDEAHVLELLDEGRKVRATVEDCFFGGTEWTIRNTRGLNPLVVRTVMGLLAKACKTHSAVDQLCISGLGTDAMTVTRSLYETTSVGLFILQKSSRLRTEMYFAHMAEQALKMLVGWKKTPRLKRKATRRLVRVATETRNMHYARLPPHVNVKRHWSGLRSLEEAAAKLHWPHSYQLFYRWASSFAHGTDLTEHVEANDDGPIMFNIAPDGANVRSALATAGVLLWIFSSRIDARFGLACAKRLDSVKPGILKRRNP